MDGRGMAWWRGTSKSQACRPLDAEDLADLDFLCSHAALRAPVAAWGHLILRFLELSVLRRASEQSIHRTAAFLGVGPALRVQALAATHSTSHAHLDFDGTFRIYGRGASSA